MSLTPWQWLTALFLSEQREVSERKIGLEVERIALWRDGSPFCYETDPQSKRPGAKDLLNQLHETYGWKLSKSPLGAPIGLDSPHGKISLEPGSQLECAVSPQPSLVEVANHLENYDQQVEKTILNWKGLYFINLGVNPLHRLDQLDVIPSPRYHIMTEILGKTGRFGTTMMRRTSSVQINLDYTSEAEAIEMLRVSLLVAPVSTALFANSPFLDGKPTGFLSTRAEVWRNTDPDRTGLMPEAFTTNFNFDQYSAYLWKMPLMFVENDEGSYIHAQGCSLEDISKRKLPGVTVNPTNMRWSVQQLFTEGRLKPGYVEIRSVDGQNPAFRLASAAFWIGLLYDSHARQLAFKLLGTLNSKDRDQLWIETSRKALKTEYKGMKIQSIAEQLVEASEGGLKKRGLKEETYLTPLKESVARGLCPAEIVLEEYRNRCQSNLMEMIKRGL